ncbi:hypothetical protein VDGL01_05401 [Verticillium dahliae]
MDWNSPLFLSDIAASARDNSNNIRRHPFATGAPHDSQTSEQARRQSSAHPTPYEPSNPSDGSHPLEPTGRQTQSTFDPPLACAVLQTFDSLSDTCDILPIDPRHSHKKQETQTNNYPTLAWLPPPASRSTYEPSN